VLLVSAINFQVSIDGGAQTQYQFNGVCDPTASSCNPTYNFTAYDIQSLQSGNHTLDLTLLDATGTDANGVNASLTIFDFDYAAVNETDAFTIQTISSTVPTSTPSTAAAHIPTTSTAAAHTPTASTTAPPLLAPSPAQ
jgi:hypothetical protein